MSKLLTEQEPSGQTVREIIDIFADGHMSANEAEAAINAHIVSVLEELKEQAEPNPTTPAAEHEFVSVSIIDAAISKYKEGGNREVN